MKKILFIAVMLFFIKSTFSQDVIITKEGESIRAKILEETDETISYKKYNDQEGATFILKKDKIKIISWENGDVDDYEKVPKAPQQEEGNLILGQANNNLPYITHRRGNTFYLDKGGVYNEVQFKQFLLERNLGAIWEKYSNGKRIKNTGLILIGAGVVLEIVGIVLTANAISQSYYYNYYYNSSNATLGVLLCSLGGALEIAGIPVAIVGGVRRNRSIQDYNTMYGGKPRTQYSQNIILKAGNTGKGLGFTLNFLFKILTYNYKKTIKNSL